jgi:hypothetical protein
MASSGRYGTSEFCVTGVAQLPDFCNAFGAPLGGRNSLQKSVRRATPSAQKSPLGHVKIGESGRPLLDVVLRFPSIKMQ